MGFTDTHNMASMTKHWRPLLVYWLLNLNVQVYVINTLSYLHQFFHLFSLLLKEEAFDFLEPDTIANLVRKYSQFINFPIYLWSSKVRFSFFFFFHTLLIDPLPLPLIQCDIFSSPNILVDLFILEIVTGDIVPHHFVFHHGDKFVGTFTILGNIRWRIKSRIHEFLCIGFNVSFTC